VVLGINELVDSQVCNGINPRPLFSAQEKNEVKNSKMGL